MCLQALQAALHFSLFKSQPCLRIPSARLPRKPNTTKPPLLLLLESIISIPPPQHQAQVDKEERRQQQEEEMVKESDDPIGLVMQRSVKQLHFGGWQEKEAAAVDIRRVAMEGRVWRKSLAGLGVIPCLVSMLDSDEDRRRSLAVLALLELASGAYSNKALMVEAGVLDKLKTLMATKNQSRRKEILALLLSISSLDKTQFHNFSSADVLLPILADTLVVPSATTDDVKLISLATLCNLSSKLENVKTIVSNKLVPVLLNLFTESSPPSVLERALVTLGNMVVTPTGRKEIEEKPMVPECFVNAMKSADDHPRCQELAAYVLMVLAHGSAMQRRKMADAGVVPALLGVALLGSELGRKRAVKLLEWLKGETMVRVVHSGPQEGRRSVVEGVVDKGEGKGRIKEMHKMVKQSLDKNMEVIMRRGSDSCGVDSSLRSLAGSFSSKSLPS